MGVQFASLHLIQSRMLDGEFFQHPDHAGNIKAIDERLRKIGTEYRSRTGWCVSVWLEHRRVQIAIQNIFQCYLLVYRVYLHRYIWHIASPFEWVEL